MKYVVESDPSSAESEIIQTKPGRTALRTNLLPSGCPLAWNLLFSVLRVVGCSSGSSESVSSCDELTPVSVKSVPPTLTASSLTSPLVLFTPLSALRIDASTATPTSLSAIEIPIAIAPENAVPRIAAVTDTAPASALTLDASVAVSVTRVARIPDGPSPSTYAFTREAILFCAETPAPPAETLAGPPNESPMLIPRTRASIRCSPCAVRASAPVDSMLESLT